MGDVPFDILINHIFLRLSVKSLLYCRRVCKQWHQILSDSDFRKTYIQQQIKKNNHHLKILCGPLHYRYDHCIYTSTYDDVEDAMIESGGMFYTLDLESAYMGEPFLETLNRLPGFAVRSIHVNLRLYRTLGYSNGMIYMSAQDAADPKWPNILFGNPSTSFYKVLPERLENGPFIIGFGYDSGSDDYKFVRLGNITRHPHIYSFKSNTWRTNLRSSDNNMIHFPKELGDTEYIHEGTFVDGSIYWYSRFRKLIVKFDLKTEMFSSVKMPPSYRYSRGILYEYESNSMQAVHGSLCMTSVLHRSFNETKNDVVMWRLGKDGHWTKLVELRELFLRKIYPLCFMKDGRIFCSVQHYFNGLKGSTPKTYFVVVDPRTSNIQDFAIPGINEGALKDFIFTTHFSGYIDTLASPN